VKEDRGGYWRESLSPSFSGIRCVVKVEDL
jgi:hypothetical protein